MKVLNGLSQTSDTGPTGLQHRAVFAFLVVSDQAQLEFKAVPPMSSRLIVQTSDR